MNTVVVAGASLGGLEFGNGPLNSAIGPGFVVYVLVVLERRARPTGFTR